MPGGGGGGGYPPKSASASTNMEEEGVTPCCLISCSKIQLKLYKNKTQFHQQYAQTCCFFKHINKLTDAVKKNRDVLKQLTKYSANKNFAIDSKKH